MNTAVEVALISASQGVLVSALGLVGYKRLRRRTDATRHEITNDHDTPLREDMDRKHGEVVRILLSQQAETRRDIGGIREEIRGLRNDDARLDRRIDDVEDTLNPRRRGRHEH